MRLIAITEHGAPAEPVAALDAIVSDVLTSMSALYARLGHVPPWLGYLALVDDRWVGTCAFVGPPQNGEVEIAYFTFPGFEGHGVATRMVGAMLEIAAATPATRSVRLYAHTLPEDNRSTAVLRKFGFTCEGEVLHPEDGTVWRWRMPPHRAATATSIRS